MKSLAEAYITVDLRFSNLRLLYGAATHPKGKKAKYAMSVPGTMLPDNYSRRDSMLVLAAMSKIGSVTTAEGASGRVGTNEVMYALHRMERPEDLWDLLFALSNDRILKMEKESQGDVRFTMVDVQAHDVTVYLHQNKEDLESYQVIEDDQEVLTKVYMDGLEEARSRAVFY